MMLHKLVYTPRTHIRTRTHNVLVEQNLTERKLRQHYQQRWNIPHTESKSTDSQNHLVKVNIPTPNVGHLSTKCAQQRGGRWHFIFSLLDSPGRDWMERTQAALHAGHSVEGAVALVLTTTRLGTLLAHTHSHKSAQPQRQTHTHKHTLSFSKTREEERVRQCEYVS